MPSLISLSWDTPISLFSATMSSLNKCGLKMAVMAGDLFQMFFLAYLAERGVDKTILKKLCIDNPGRLLTA